MKSYWEWQLEQELTEFNENSIIQDWVEPLLSEATSTSRYSIEVNYRSKSKEILDAFAKICLGYISAGMKQSGYHVKHVYDEKPLRIVVSSRNWDPGEWTGLVYYHPEHDGGCFIIAKGFYNKDVKTISLQSRQKCKGTSAAEITNELRTLMHTLKNKPDRNTEKLRGPAMKRGPKG